MLACRTEAFYTRWLTLDMEHVQYWLTTRATVSVRCTRPHAHTLPGTNIEARYKTLRYSHYVENCTCVYICVPHRSLTFSTFHVSLDRSSAFVRMSLCMFVCAYVCVCVCVSQELEDAYSSLRNKLACERDVLGTLAEAIRAHTESQGGQNSDVSSLGQLEGLQYSEAARAVLAAPLDPDCPICHDTVQVRRYVCVCARAGLCVGMSVCVCPQLWQVHVHTLENMCDCMCSHAHTCGWCISVLLLLTGLCVHGVRSSLLPRVPVDTHTHGGDTGSSTGSVQPILHTRTADVPMLPQDHCQERPRGGTVTGEKCVVCV